MPKVITESEVEQVALDIFSELGYKVIYGPDIAPEESGATLIPNPSPYGRGQGEGNVDGRIGVIWHTQGFGKKSDSRDKLRELLKVASGGIVFTTIQKFFPEEKGGRYPTLSDRRNVVVIGDEAHRSQYDFIDGFARYYERCPAINRITYVYPDND